MEPTNWFLPAQNDCDERQPNMDPHASLWEVVIEGIELKQRAPSFSFSSLPPDLSHFDLFYILRFDLLVSSRTIDDSRDLACEIASLDALALFNVMLRVEKNDNLREVLARAIRSNRQAILHAGCSDDWCAFDPLVIVFHSIGAASKPGSKQEYVDASESDSELAIAYAFHAFLTSVLHLLTSVFQYLIGYVDRGGSKTYSSGAFDFRASFVSLVLFQGAYVWIKFRQAARPGCRKRKAPDVNHEVADIEPCNHRGVYARPIKEKPSGVITRFKYEPRFTPPRQKGDDDKRLSLGEYHTSAEAQIVRQIARYYYDKDGGCVELEDGRYKLPIPPMSEQERRLAGKEKRKWVTCRAKQVGKQIYADFQREKGKHLDIMAVEAGSHGTEFNDPSSSALPLACPSLPVLTTTVAEPAIGSAAPSSPSLPLPPFDSGIVGDAYNSCKDPSGCEDMIAEVYYDSERSNPQDHQSSVVSYPMHYQGFAQLPGDPGVAGGIEHDSEPELNRDPSFQQGRVLVDAGTENIDGMVFLPQSVPDLQQLLLCQKKCLEDNARQFVDMDHQLKAYQIQNSRLQQEHQIQISKLQQEKEQLRTENESLKSRLEQVAKAQVATWTGIMIGI